MGGNMTTISVADVVVSESDGFADFVVRLDAPSGISVSVNYGTGQLTAAAGFDYTTTSGTLTFLPGEVLKTVRVPIFNDTATEGHEVFRLSLSGPSPVGSVFLGNNSATATLLDNDRTSGIPIVSI